MVRWRRALMGLRRCSTWCCKKKLAVELDGQDVALMMMSLKLCREANEHSWDNLVDLAGYAALKGQLAESTRAKAKGQVEPASDASGVTPARGEEL
jgi:hypothetical protein